MHPAPPLGRTLCSVARFSPVTRVPGTVSGTCEPPSSFPSGTALRPFIATVAVSDFFVPYISGFRDCSSSLCGSVRPRSNIETSQVPMKYVRQPMGSLTPRNPVGLTITAEQVLPKSLLHLKPRLLFFARIRSKSERRCQPARFVQYTYLYQIFINKQLNKLY